MPKEPLLEKMLKLSLLMKQIRGQGLSAEAKEIAINNAQADAYQDSVKFLIDVNKEKRDESKFKMDKQTWLNNQAKIGTDKHNKERDEHQENIKMLEQWSPGASIDYAANLTGKYLPRVSSQARAMQGNASLLIGDVNKIMVDSSIDDIDRSERIKAIRTANIRNISPGTLANIDGALGIVDSRIHETVKNRWISRNINHPDAGRIGLLPPTDAYEEILKKDPIKDINALVNRVTRNTSALADLKIGGAAMTGIDTKGVEKVLTKQIGADTKTLNTLTEVTTGPDPVLFNKAFKGFKDRNPKYFTTDASGNNIIVPEFKHVVEDSVGAIYSKMINQP